MEEETKETGDRGDGRHGAGGKGDKGESSYICNFNADQMSRKGKVLVAMSGGIDSTVTALMLHEQGYEVVGITMKTWDYASSGSSKKETGCCNIDSFNDARMAAVQHGFPHFILDIREEFGDFVIENFVDEYLAGRTPNPCVMCNTHIKWRALLKRADALDCDYIATGHYANIHQHTNGRYFISKGLDETKDQSYVLWGLQQDLLSRTLLPLGTYRKTEIRQMAHDFGYPELAKKAESYEICFVPDFCGCFHSFGHSLIFDPVDLIHLHNRAIQIFFITQNHCIGFRKDAGYIHWFT